MKIAPKQCIRWKACGGVEEFCNKQGIPQNQYAFSYRRWTKCSDLNLIEFTLTINSNSFYSSFLWKQNLNRRLHRPFLKKGNSPVFNSATPKFIFLNLSSFLFLLKKFYGGIEMNFGWLVASIAVPPICFLIKYHCTNGLYYFSWAMTNQVPLH